MDIIDALAKLDWFEAVGTLFRAGTPAHKFAVSRNCGWSGQQIQDMLKSRGVKMWGRGFTENTFTFRVKKVQAGWAEYLLHQHGIPIHSRAFNARNAQHAPATPPGSPPQKQPDPVKKLLDVLWN